jgi:hypothetical protein
MKFTVLVEKRVKFVLKNKKNYKNKYESKNYCKTRKFSSIVRAAGPSGSDLMV